MLAGGVRCLVTGGAGFIGSHVATRLAALGCGVRVVDDLSTGDESNLTELAGRIEFLRGDLCDPEVCREAVEGVAVVLHLAALRYFNVFGPRQSPHSAYAAVIPAFLSAAAEGRRPVVFGDGSQTRDFTFVDNVVEANILAATRPREAANGWVVNVGAGVRTSLLALLDVIRNVTGRAIHPECRSSRPGDVHDSLASLDRAAQVLRYRPAIGLEA